MIFPKVQCWAQCFFKIRIGVMDIVLQGQPPNNC